MTCSSPHPGEQLEPGQSAAELAAAPALSLERGATQTDAAISNQHKRPAVALRRRHLQRHAEGAASIAADADRLLDKDEAAAFLGVAPRTLYKWAAQERLPVVRLGRAVRFRMSALRAFVREHEEPAAVPLGGVVSSLVRAGTERATPTRP